MSDRITALLEMEKLDKEATPDHVFRARYRSLAPLLAAEVRRLRAFVIERLCEEHHPDRGAERGAHDLVCKHARAALEEKP